MSFFSADLEATTGLFETVFGEPVTIVPMARVAGDRNARPNPDADRPETGCIGIWDETPTDLFPESQQVPGKASHRLSAGTVVVTIAKAALSFEPRQGDIIIRAADGRRLAICDPADDGITDWILTLTSK